MKYLFMIMVLLFSISANANCLDDIVVHLLKDNPNHKFMKNEEERNQFVNAIQTISMKYHLDPVLGILMAYKESTYNYKAKGDYKNGKFRSFGLFQFGYTVRRKCKKIGFNIGTIDGQITCYSYWLDQLRFTCGSMNAALLGYTSGKCKGTPRAKRVVSARLKKVKQLKKQFCGVEKK